MADFILQPLGLLDVVTKLRLAREYSIERIFKEYQELLSNDMNAVIIETPPFLHREQGIVALK